MGNGGERRDNGRRRERSESLKFLDV